ncbi:unnamed protein product, partial [Prorocentrum cordatum]
EGSLAALRAAKLATAISAIKGGGSACAGRWKRSSARPRAPLTPAIIEEPHKKPIEHAPTFSEERPTADMVRELQALAYCEGSRL